MDLFQRKRPQILAGIWVRYEKIGSGMQNRQYLRNGWRQSKITLNGLYLVVQWISIAAKMYDLEWPLSEIQGRWFFKCRYCRKNDEVQLNNDSDAM